MTVITGTEFNGVIVCGADPSVLPIVPVWSMCHSILYAIIRLGLGRRDERPRIVGIRSATRDVSGDVLLAPCRHAPLWNIRMNYAVTHARIVTTDLNPIVRCIRYWSPRSRWFVHVIRKRGISGSLGTDRSERAHHQGLLHTKVNGFGVRCARPVGAVEPLGLVLIDECPHGTVLQRLIRRLGHAHPLVLIAAKHAPRDLLAVLPAQSPIRMIVV
mmetsp:Transcript_38049/g.79717  ORF Transcript_38049/g.79717 Transcript_38049/m.79717 type:complete len:215 (-) Transcript_38049:1643-2287(-)